MLRDKKIKQSELAVTINRAPSTVSEYVNGTGSPGVSALTAIARALDIPIDSLMKADEEVENM
ncbi:helix-turn-helix transcriptional regulator [Bacillus thuringiensis]|uniref:Transcriptional regulator n=1 Tax=Bacillus thuringiensis TaxID=1428 RepID=A0A9X6KKE4_BACTU|nr:helix-turn-helix transcriptional regulator [Bacillus thuringiensis]MDA2536826.1 helix-turn-helix transcriptional regulator [Bacillus cereus]MEB9462284.1 helix-turn-helix transcriptional regulator [Bacillus cereus]OTZ04537.1 transcriptional regulator [Bacillus thuringiensis serovar aizawai]OUA17075.1 transcriptional regulator [Bacillus thuringiensis]OXR51239.1 transcriptional regulator [Bacillus thuringiensis]